MLRIVLLALALMAPAAVHANPSEAAMKYQRCVARESQGLVTPEDAKRMCKPGVMVQAPRIGWHCANNGTRDRVYKAPGGFARKRDMVCGEE
jgi:hypothetical protein